MKISTHLVTLIFLTCLAFLTFSFPSCTFCVYHNAADDIDAISGTLKVMYLKRLLAVFNTNTNATDVQKLMECAPGSCGGGRT